MAERPPNVGAFATGSRSIVLTNRLLGFDRKAKLLCQGTLSSIKGDEILAASNLNELVSGIRIGGGEDEAPSGGDPAADSEQRGGGRGGGRGGKRGGGEGKGKAQ